jgi:hypothetical protein
MYAHSPHAPAEAFASLYVRIQTRRDITSKLNTGLTGLLFPILNWLSPHTTRSSEHARTISYRYHRKPTCALYGAGYYSCCVAVDVFPPRHSARPFHHTRSSIACLHPPHPPITITQAPAALPLTTSSPSDFLRPFPRSLVPPSLLLSCAPLCLCHC